MKKDNLRQAASTKQGSHGPHSLTGWRYIVVELAIVTAGLFIALMLNAVVEWAHHKQLVHDAQRNIGREIGRNRQILRDDIGNLRSSLSGVERNIATLQRMRAGQFSHASLSNAITYNTLDDAAWQTARDTGALSYMSYDQAQRYSDAYGGISYVNGRGIALIDVQFNAAAPAEMGYDIANLPPDEIAAMLRGNAQAKISLIQLIQMLSHLDAQLAEVSRR